MFATHDQENLTHAHQTAAAAKPLNRGFGAKTPGNIVPKTPFKIPLNDENAQFRAGKSVLKTNGKGNENLMLPTKKGGEVDRSAFITPAGPRNRAPLGKKTTNAKTRVFQTPAPIDNTIEKTQPKTQSPRLRRAKVKVHLGDANSERVEDEEREIEYMPPRGEPLPDFDDTLAVLDSFPMFEGANMTRGMYETYYDPVDEGGIPLSVRTANERYAQLDKELEDQCLEQIEDDHISTLESLGFQDLAARERAKRFTLGRIAMSNAKPVARSSKPITKGTIKQNIKPVAKSTSARLPGTIAARTAAAALSKPPPNSLAATKNTTASMRAKASARPTSALTKARSAVATNSNSTMRHTAATVVSKTTLGYGKGRVASGAIRKSPMTLQELNASKQSVNSGANEGGLETQLLFGGLTLDDGSDDDLFGNRMAACAFEEDSEEEFQLKLPAGF